MNRRLLMLLPLLMWPLAASALLPPAAEYREREILQYRQRRMEESERKNREYDRQMILRDQEVRKNMAVPPWRRAAAPTAVSAIPSVSGETSASARESAASHPGRKWMFGLIALFFIGGAVWWVHIATEPES